MSKEILQEVINNVENGNKVALCTVLEASGSTPAKPNFMMIVLEDKSTIGTVGGGEAEFKIINDATIALKNNKNTIFDYDLSGTGNTSMICGGKIKGSIQIFEPINELVIFGGGHVSQKLALLAIFLKFKVTVIDERESYKDYFPCDVTFYESENYDLNDLFIKTKPHTYCVIATKGHESDKQALLGILSQNKENIPNYIGMIGSKKKAIKLQTDLDALNLSLDYKSILYSPIGLDISNGTTEEIAMSIMSEILAHKNNLNPVHRKLND